MLINRFNYLVFATIGVVTLAGCRNLELQIADSAPGDQTTPMTWDTDDLSRFGEDTAETGPDTELSDAGAMDGGVALSERDPLRGIPPSAGPRNFVFFIGDGMGLNHIASTSMFEYGVPGEVFFQSFEVQGMMTTHSADTDITDSAAAATAMASGQKVKNGVIGLEIPGEGGEIPNMVEYFKSLGKATGLVTTATVTHATPAGFGAHTTHRNNTVEIAEDYLNQTRPNVLFGGGGSGMSPELAAEAGYAVFETLVDFDPDALSGDDVHISGQFGIGYMGWEYDGLDEGIPHLWETGEAAVSALMTDPDGFFVMIEGGRIDHASHDNRFERMVSELMAFERTVATIVTDTRLVDNTLFIVTADHGTGGLVIDNNNGRGELPDVHWSSVVHTGEDVPIYAQGPGAEAFAAAIDAMDGRIDNTDIFRIVTELIAW